MRDLVTQRRQQGWRASIPVGAVRKQLVEVHAEEASVLSISFDTSQGAQLDDAGFIDAETRVDEAVRSRTFATRRQGMACNVPAGITRVFCRGFAKPYTAYISLARGFAVSERLAQELDAPPFAVLSVEAPEFARTVSVAVQYGHAQFQTSYGGGGYSDIQTPLGLILTPGLTPATPTLPAYGSIQIREIGGTGAAVTLIWEIFA